MATQSVQRHPIPRCSSCRAWLPKTERATWPRLCRSCREEIHAAWKRDLHAVMAPDWPARTAAEIRAERQAVAR